MSQLPHRWAVSPLAYVLIVEQHGVEYAERYYVTWEYLPTGTSSNQAGDHRINPKDRSRPVSDAPGWELVLEFPDQSPSFCYGFEAGQIWERMKAGVRIEQTVNDDNRDAYVRMARAMGWRAEFERINDDGWETLILTPPKDLP